MTLLALSYLLDMPPPPKTLSLALFAGMAGGSFILVELFWIKFMPDGDFLPESNCFEFSLRLWDVVLKASFDSYGLKASKTCILVL